MRLGWGAIAGLPIERVTGTKTSVYVGCFTKDWQHIQLKDAEQAGATAALGTQPCINANRISWFFDFNGNSCNVDTACSSSLVCLDLGCAGLLTGDASMVCVHPPPPCAFPVTPPPHFLIFFFFFSCCGCLFVCLFAFEISSTPYLQIPPLPYIVSLAAESFFLFHPPPAPPAEPTHHEKRLTNELGLL